MRMTGKTAIVTGGGAGIGEATVQLFAEEGGQVLVADVDEQGGETSAASVRARRGRAIFVKSDVSKEGDGRRMRDACVREFGKSDVLVGSAATLVLRGAGAAVSAGIRGRPGAVPPVEAGRAAARVGVPDSLSAVGRGVVHHRHPPDGGWRLHGRVGR